MKPRNILKQCQYFVQHKGKYTNTSQYAAEQETRIEIHKSRVAADKAALAEATGDEKAYTIISAAKADKILGESK